MDQFTQTSTSYSGTDKMIDVGEDTKLAEFVGEKKRDFYLKKWKKDNSWNWAAFFLTFLWLGYRKMYKPILYVILAFLAIDIIVLLLGIEGSTIDTSLGFALSGSLGIGGNLLYKRHAQKQIKEVDQLSLGEKEKMHEIRKRGGTSGMGAFLAFLMFLGYIAISLILMLNFS